MGSDSPVRERKKEELEKSEAKSKDMNEDECVIISPKSKNKILDKKEKRTNSNTIHTNTVKNKKHQ